MTPSTDTFLQVLKEYFPKDENCHHLLTLKLFQTWGAFPVQRRNSLIKHFSMMHCCGNKPASHNCFPNTVASPLFEPH